MTLITCTSVSNAMLSNSTISGVALGGSLFAHTVSGSITGTSYNGSAAVSDWTLNMANANSWTAGQSFVNATSTGALYAASSTLDKVFTTNGTSTNFASASSTLDKLFSKNASTTFLGLPNITSNFLYTNSQGTVFGAASSSFFGYTPLNPTRQLTIAGTANQITSSAGAQDLSADRTWTLSIPALFNITQASTTMFSTLGPLYVGTTSTTTIWGNATSTFRGGIVSATGGLTVSTLTSCDTIDTDGSGKFKCGADASGGAATAGGTDTQVQFNDGGTTIGGAADFVFIKSNNRVGIGTTTPFAGLSIHATSTTGSGFGGSGLSTLFAIASSSQGNSTTTLLRFSNTGNLTWGATPTTANYNINIDAQTTTDTAGNAFNFLAGTGNGTGVGGPIFIQAGAGGNTGNGGSATLRGGNGGTGGNTTGGAAQFTGGAGRGSGTGGGVTLTAGAGGSTNGAGGAVTVTGGGGGSTNGAGGAITFTAGTSQGTGMGGTITINGGIGSFGGTSGDAKLVGGSGSTVDSLNGGHSYVTGGAAGSGGGDANGGTVFIQQGNKFGSGKYGDILFQNGAGTLLGTFASTTGNFGVASTSPWGLLSVNPNGITGPAFAIGSSTKTDFMVDTAGRTAIGTFSPFSGLVSVISNLYSRMFTIATSSTDNPIFDVSATTTGNKNWARVAIGTSSQTGIGQFFPLTVQGEIYSTKKYYACENMAQFSAQTADVTNTTCGSAGWTFDEDNQGAVTSMTNTAAYEQNGTSFAEIWSGLTASTAALTTVGDGAAIVSGGNIGLSTASSSPVFESYASASSTNATSTIFALGLSSNATGNNWGLSNASEDNLPGYFFIATSTTPNGDWMAYAKDNGAAATMVDTGIASSTVSTGNSTYHKFRVVVVTASTGAVTANYYIDDILRAILSPTKSNALKQILDPFVAVGVPSDGTAGLAKSMRVSYIRAWADLIPTNN